MRDLLDVPQVFGMIHTLIAYSESSRSVYGNVCTRNSGGSSVPQ